MVLINEVLIIVFNVGPDFRACTSIEVQKCPCENVCQEVNKEQWKCKTVYEKKCPKYGTGYCKDVAKVVCNSVPVTKCDKKSKMTCTLSSSRANKLEISERSIQIRVKICQC